MPGRSPKAKPGYLLSVSFRKACPSILVTPCVGFLPASTTMATSARFFLSAADLWPAVGFFYLRSGLPGARACRSTKYGWSVKFGPKPGWSHDRPDASVNS